MVTGVKAAISEGAASLAADIAVELKDVKGIIDTLRAIARNGGMPRVRACLPGPWTACNGRSRRGKAVKG